MAFQLSFNAGSLPSGMVQGASHCFSLGGYMVHSQQANCWERRHRQRRLEDGHLYLWVCFSPLKRCKYCLREKLGWLWTEFYCYPGPYTLVLIDEVNIYCVFPWRIERVVVRDVSCLERKPAFTTFSTSFHSCPFANHRAHLRTPFPKFRWIRKDGVRESQTSSPIHLLLTFDDI